MRFLNKIILKFLKKDITKELNILMSIQLNDINKILIKQCCEKSLKVKYISRCKNKVVIMIRNKNKTNLILIHRSVAGTLNDYDRFVDLYSKTKANKAFYICTGVFQQDVYNKNYNLFLHKHVVLVDGSSFLMKQKCFTLKRNRIFDYSKISFDKFLPR